MLECNGQKVREVVRANRQGLDTHRVNVCLNAATHAVLLYHRLKRIGNAAGPKIHTEYIEYVYVKTIKRGNYQTRYALNDVKSSG